MKAAVSVAAWVAWKVGPSAASKAARKVAMMVALMGATKVEQSVAWWVVTTVV